MLAVLPPQAEVPRRALQSRQDEDHRSRRLGVLQSLVERLDHPAPLARIQDGSGAWGEGHQGTALEHPCSGKIRARPEAALGSQAGSVVVHDRISAFRAGSRVHPSR